MLHGCREGPHIYRAVRFGLEQAAAHAQMEAAEKGGLLLAVLLGDLDDTFGNARKLPAQSSTSEPLVRAVIAVYLPFGNRLRYMQKSR